MDTTTISIDETDIGWVACLWRADTLLRLTMGHSTATAAVDALGSDAADAAEDATTTHARLHQRLQAVIDGAEDRFTDIDIDLSHLTPFARRVVTHCRKIRPGQTVTYAGLAAKAGSPRAARAVGNVMANNRFPLIVPCHRVVGSGGSLGGFSAPDGIDLKRRLLNREGIAV